MPLEGKEALLEPFQGRKVVGGQNLPLENGKVDFDLIEPAGVDGTVNGNDAWIFFHKAFHASGAAMRGSVVHDPEHSPGLAIGRLGHHLSDQPIKGDDPGLSLAPAKELCPANVECRDVRPSSAPPVFVFDPHCFPGPWRKGRVLPGAGLNGDLLVRRQNELVVLEPLSLKNPLVQIENARGFGRKVRIPRKDPATVLPRPDRILGKPAPDGAVADLGHQPGAPGLPRHVGDAQPGKRNPQRCGQFTGQGLYVDDEFRGGKPAGGRGAAARQAPAGVAHGTAFAIGRRPAGSYPGGRQSHRCPILRPQAGSSWLGVRDNTVTYTLPRVVPVRSSLPVTGGSGTGFFSAWRRPSLSNTMP